MSMSTIQAAAHYAVWVSRAASRVTVALMHYTGVLQKLSRRFRLWCDDQEVAAELRYRACAARFPSSRRYVHQLRAGPPLAGSRALLAEPMLPSSLAC
jgi:hypothetical protein